VELTKQKSNNKIVYIFCLPMHVWALMGAHQTALQNGHSSMEELLGPKELTKVLIMDGLAL
jgi:hypothetical protein